MNVPKSLALDCNCFIIVSYKRINNILIFSL